MIREIRRGRSFLVTTHFNPDADALGSALGLAIALRRLKKKVKVYNRDPVPCNLRFLPGADQVVSELKEAERFDATFVVDCADLSRVEKSFPNHQGMGRRIIIDHHLRGDRQGDLLLIDEAAVSTGVVVLRLLKGIPAKITSDIGTCLYTTIVGDTGNFRYSNTDSAVLQLAHDLVAGGVNPWFVSKNLYENFPPERLTLLARVLSTLELSHDGRIASTLITREMLRETGATVDLAEEFVNFPRSIGTVEVAIQLREIEDGTKVSLRSKEDVDVSEVASRFGGGGHARAAGCVIPVPLPEAKEKILGAVREALRG